MEGQREWEEGGREEGSGRERGREQGKEEDKGERETKIMIYYKEMRVHSIIMRSTCIDDVHIYH